MEANRKLYPSVINVQYFELRTIEAGVTLGAR
jgi:hypothetical protein